MGSKQRFAYSALGDTVNLASRLEMQTKNYGVDNLIGEDTQAYVPDFATLELDYIRVKGKVKPVKIFTLLGDSKAENDPAFREWRSAHNGMLELYRSKNFLEASKSLENCLQKSGGRLTGFYEMYKKRIDNYISNPPPESWNGVYVAKTK
jgi:adenylate cyclase